MASIGSSAESVRSTIAAHNVTSPVGAEVMSALTGAFRGESVASSDEASKLNDMKEEIGNVFTMHKSDHLKNMKVKAGQGTNLEAIKRINDYLDKLPDMPRGEKLTTLVKEFESFIERLSKQLESGGGGGGALVSADDILKALQNYDGDVTHQFVALEGALATYEMMGANAEMLGLSRPRAEAVQTFVAQLKQAQVEYERADTARDVRAGLAVAKVANELAPTLETDPAALRESYRAMLRQTPPRLADVYRALSGQDLTKGFKETVEGLTKATRTDLDAAHPSIDKTNLQQLLNELSRMKQLTSVFDLSGTLVRNVGNLVSPSDKAKLDPAAFTGAVLDFVALQPASVADANKLLLGFGSASPETRVHLVNALRDLHGELPDAVFPDMNARRQQRDVLLGLSGTQVAAEEASFSGEIAN